MVIQDNFQSSCQECIEKEDRDYEIKPQKSDRNTKKIRRKVNESIKIMQWNADSVTMCSVLVRFIMFPC